MIPQSEGDLPMDSFSFVVSSNLARQSIFKPGTASHGVGTYSQDVVKVHFVDY